jgi:regulator of sigma E protease
MSEATPWEKTIIYLAGPAANLLAGITIFFVVAAIAGIPHPSTKIGSCVPDTPAARAGIMPGDRVAGVNGVSVQHWDQFTNQINLQMNNKEIEIKTVLLSLNRNGLLVYAELAPIKKGDLWVVGVRAAGEISLELLGIIDAEAWSIKKSWDMVDDIGRFVGRLFSFRAKFAEMAGPMGIFEAGSGTARYGVGAYLVFVATVSINLFVFNLLPFCPLDGGEITFAIYEAVFSKPPRPLFKKIISTAGIMLFLSLFFIVVLNDFAKTLF